MGSCFYITPFYPPTHHYLFLLLKNHLESQYGLLLQRADKRYSGKGFMDKIIKMIEQSEFVIADCSGNRGNVFYELGIAHAKNIPVILISY